MFDSQLSGPQFVQLFGPVIEALKALGGSALPAEVRNQIAEVHHVSEEEQQFQIPDYGHSKPLIYRSLLIMVKLD